MGLVTLDGLSPSIGNTLTGEMIDRYREQQLTIENTNDIDFRNFSARIQLPEPVAVDDLPPVKLISNLPPSVHLRWMPDIRNGSIDGTGQLTVMTNQRPTANWVLDIDSIPALTEIDFSFLTVPPSSAPEETDLNKKLLVNFISGTFQYPASNGWATRPLLFPILYDSTNRLMWMVTLQNPNETYIMETHYDGPSAIMGGPIKWSFPKP